MGSLAWRAMPASPSCGRHRQVQIADWSDEVPRTPEELQKFAAEFQASTFIRTHRLFKYVKKNIFRFIPILVRAEQ